MSRGPLKDALSAQKALQGSETRELPKGTCEKRFCAKKIQTGINLLSEQTWSSWGYTAPDAQVERRFLEKGKNHWKVAWLHVWQTFRKCFDHFLSAQLKAKTRNIWIDKWLETFNKKMSLPMLVQDSAADKPFPFVIGKEFTPHIAQKIFR